MSAELKFDQDAIEMVALTIRGYKRNGFNDDDIRFKLRKFHDDTLVEAAFNLCKQEDSAHSSPSAHSLKEPSDYYGW